MSFSVNQQPSFKCKERQNKKKVNIEVERGIFHIHFTQLLVYEKSTLLSRDNLKHLLFTQDVFIDTVFRFTVYLTDRVFDTFSSEPSGWTHIVMNYIGPNDGEGIRIYYNGTQVASGTNLIRYFDQSVSKSGDGRIVVGRPFTDKDERYVSIQVDELIFFNRALTTDEVQANLQLSIITVSW